FLAPVATGDDAHGVIAADAHRHLEYLRGERDDLHEVLLAQLARDRAEDAGAGRVVLIGEDDGGVVVELDVGAVRPAVFLRGADDDRLDDVALLDGAARGRLLDRSDDDIADLGVLLVRAAQDPNEEKAPGAG